MPSIRIRADHDSLSTIAQGFEREANNTRQTLQRLKSQLEVLQGGDWIGKGGTAFFAEMNSDVLPAIARLAAALEAAQRTTRQISQVMQEAEDEASSIFERGGLDTTPGGAPAPEGGPSPSGTRDEEIFGGVYAALGGGGGVAGGGTPGGGSAGGGASSGGGSTSAGSSSGGGGGASAGGGASSGGAPAGGNMPGGNQNPLLAQDPAQLFNDSYMSGMVGTTFEGADSPEMREALLGLAQNPTGADLDRLLEKIAKLRGRPVSDIKKEYEKFLKIRAQAVAVAAANGQPPPPPLSEVLQSAFMGSTQQLRFGKVVGEAFGVDPVFGALLSPTGGMGATDGLTLPTANSAAGYQAVFQDAATYLSNYHRAGPGQNYLGGGPQTGLQYWTQKVGLP